MQSSSPLSDPPLIFISHDGRDAELAEAFCDMLHGASAGVLRPFRSSDHKGGQGIEYGVEWYPQLMDKLVKSTDVVCLLTENSLERPWILYEAGVAKGKLSTPVYGVALGIPLNRANSGPFAQFQNCAGVEEELTKLLTQLIRRIPGSEPHLDTLRLLVNMFLAKVNDCIKGAKVRNPPKEEELADASAAKLFEEVKVMFKDLPSTSALAKLGDRLEETFEAALGKVENGIGKLSSAERQSEFSASAISDAQTEQGRLTAANDKTPLDEVVLFWRSLAFGSPIPDVYREPSSIYVAYCNEPPRWLPKDKEDDPRGFRSGSGEVAAAFELGSVLGRAGLSYEVVRSRNLKSVEILAKTDIMLLVLGSTLSFEHLDDIRRQIWPSSQRFKFDWEETGFDNRGQPQGYGFILDTISGRKFVNLDMQEGKPETQYALVSIIRNDKSQLFVNLAGISTLGTEAAVKLLCNPVTLRQVLEKLAISDLTVPSFELLLEMNINWDIPYLPKIVDYVCPVNAPETVAAATAAS